MERASTNVSPTSPSPVNQAPVNQMPVNQASTSGGPRTVREWLRAALAFDPALASAARDEEIAGELVLAEHQLRAARRGVAIVQRYGGVLLADAVGLGKTRTTLAMARLLARAARRLRGLVPAGPVVACVPARLLTTWTREATRDGWKIPDELSFVTHTQLSARPYEPGERWPAALVVDEAHQFRNPRTRRAAHLAELAARVPTVLVTATPVCNGIDDLHHLLAMFLAEHDTRALVGLDLSAAFDAAKAGTFDLTELVERFVIRRVVVPGFGAGEGGSGFGGSGFGGGELQAEAGGRPRVRFEQLSYTCGADERWMWEHLGDTLRAMSLALLADDWPRGLFLEFMQRRWESGPQALAESLRTLCAYHRRWLEVTARGQSLSREAFDRIFGGGAARQEVLPFVFDLVDAPEPGEGAAGCDKELRARVEDDLATLERLLTRADAIAAHALTPHALTQQGRTPEGAGPVGAVLALIARRPDDKLLVFTSYEQTAIGYYDAIRAHLGSRARVGLVTGRGARATGIGRARADEIVHRFAPRAAGDTELPEHQQLAILVCTDCLSEGVNLQDCGHVVLADLPYSPLRVEQRIGRLVRPASRHREVTVYLPRPDDWNDSLGLRRRLASKIAGAERSGTGYRHASVLARRPGTAPRAAGTDGGFDEPLAALVGLDQVAAMVGARPEHRLPGGAPAFYRVRCDRLVAGLWLRVLVHDGAQTRATWCHVGADGHVEHRLARLLPGLVALSESTARLEPVAAPPRAALERATEALEARRDLLRAARLAPMPLRADMPQHLLWQRICEWPGDVDREALRARLLHPMPRGIARWLEALASADLPPERLVAELSKLEPVAWPGTIEFEIAMGLEVVVG